jgi:hypothetical protein
MISKINTADIVRDHLRTLVNEHSGKISVGDYVLFFVLPAIVALLLLWLKGVFGPNVGGILITAFSIFAALLFNLLLLVYDIVKKTDEISLKRRFLKQIYSNISYAVFISIALIIFLLAYFVSMTSDRLLVPRYVLAFFVYTLSGNFVLSMLMILKRIHILLAHEFESLRPE